MAKSKAKTPEAVDNAQDQYKKAVESNTGSQGYDKLRAYTTTNRNLEIGPDGEYHGYTDAGKDTLKAYKMGQQMGNAQSGSTINNSITSGKKITNSANTSAASGAKSQMANVNAEAQKYAAQQAQAAAAGAQNQATTAARAAGMNKAQAAMLGSQQNANAFQNAYGNAYGTQLGTANSAFENQANRANANIANASGLYNNNANQYAAMQNANNQYQQSLMASMQGANVSGIGNQVSMAQQQDAQNYAQGGLFSDERLKHYKECSKKVVVRSPSKIKALKYTPKGE